MLGYLLSDEVEKNEEGGHGLSVEAFRFGWKVMCFSVTQRSGVKDKCVGSV